MTQFLLEKERILNEFLPFSTLKKKKRVYKIKGGAEKIIKVSY